MAIPTLVQKGKNSVVYATNALQVALPTTATAGNCLVIAIEAAKVTDPFSVTQMAAGADRIDGSTLVTAPPVVKDNLGNTFSIIDSLINFDGDLGYYSTTYLYYAANVAGGNQYFNVTVADVTGRPTFNHGLNAQVYEFSGISTSPLDGHNSQESNANPAVAPSITTTATGDLVFLVGHARKTGSISVPSGFTLLDSGRINGTANDYHVSGFLTGGSIASQTVTIADIAITSNVLTVTGTNTLQTGATVLLAGLTTNTFLNGQTVTVTGSTGSTFTAAFTHANVSSGVDTGTAVGGPALLPTGGYQPGFVNPGRYNIGVSILALKHS
jgi:hypothetical protein